VKTGIIYTIAVTLLTFQLNGQNTSPFKFSGQVSAWANYNQSNQQPLWMGARYIPEGSYRINLPKKKMIDIEAAANINGSVGLGFSDSPPSDGNVKPYRAWARYSGNQFEVRMGLQKINFGSASMLRPLMWFDQMDPRDPLQLTDGVWGILGKYYFLNNANLWFWGLIGNEGPKTWEIGQTIAWTPEFGGRLQLPVWRGEAALSAHHRQVDTHQFAPFMHVVEKMPESRLGLDAKWDLEVGFWVEASLISKHRDFGMLTHQHMFTSGVDYTFGMGNGLNAMIENLWFAPGKELFNWDESVSFSALSVSYPISMFANINAIVYYDWKNKQTYNFLNIKQDYRKVTFYLMGFWNPDTFQLPQQTGSGNLFAGKGLQVMLVYNH
jgi:hypothetical protein